MATLVVSWCEEVEEVERAGPSASKATEDEAHYLRVIHNIQAAQISLCQLGIIATLNPEARYTPLCRRVEPRELDRKGGLTLVSSGNVSRRCTLSLMK
jgi:hypothetical protein